MSGQPFYSDALSLSQRDEANLTGTAVLIGSALLIQAASQPILQLWDCDSSVLGQSLRAVLPDTSRRLFLDQLEHVFSTGNPYYNTKYQADRLIDGQPQTHWYNVAFTPLPGTDGRIGGVVAAITDITQAVTTYHQLEAIRDEHQLAIDLAELGNWDIDGATGRITFDERVRDWWGYPDDIVASQAFDYIHPDDRAYALSGFDAMQRSQQHRLDVSYRVINPTTSRERFLRILAYNHFDVEGQLQRISGTSMDVTQQVQRQQQLEQIQASLRGAIELAQLAIWSWDIVNDQFTYDERSQQWWGYTPGTTASQALTYIYPDDQNRAMDALNNTLTPGSGGTCDVEYRVINPATGVLRVVRVWGQARFGADGQPVFLHGIAQDVTAQRALQTRLEQLVAERTQDLQLANQDLRRSNENLQQFAYVASHDLQEPLRKIQAFSSLLDERYAARLGPDGRAHLQRMQQASARMSTLIRDLLSFARLTIRAQTPQPVALNALLTDVLTMMELPVQESAAQISIGDLPTVNGDAAQLSRLFQNLLSNALKFTTANQTPVIQISSCPILRADLPEAVQPDGLTQVFYRIDVRDNGIGFDNQYRDRIFQVFQRLHGKQEYVGTGIGLAICQRVVENHGGAITADGTPGQGATFSVYLPAVAD